MLKLFFPEMARMITLKETDGTDCKNIFMPFLSNNASREEQVS